MATTSPDPCPPVGSVGVRAPADRSLLLPSDRHGLITSADVARAGQSGTLQALYRSGGVERLWPGVYRRMILTDTRPQAERRAADYRLRVLAASRRLRQPVFTSWSAAALLGLPIIGDWPQEVFVLSGRRSGARAGKVVYVASRGEAPQVSIDGLTVTSVEYTLIQLARHARLGAAVVAADAALRDMPFLGQQLPLTTMAAVRGLHEDLLPYHRSSRMLALLERATHLSGSPLETVSRLTVEELGFAAPLLQAHIPLQESGGNAYLDFLWDEDIGAEADGDSKYVADDNSAETRSRLVAEKKREDEIRRELRAFTRWGWRDAWFAGRLEKRLLAIGVPRERPAGARFW